MKNYQYLCIFMLVSNIMNLISFLFYIHLMNHPYSSIFINFYLVIICFYLLYYNFSSFNRFQIIAIDCLFMSLYFINSNQYLSLKNYWNLIYIDC